MANSIAVFIGCASTRSLSRGATWGLVAHLVGNYAPDAAQRVFNVAFPSRNQMDVAVENGLPGYSADICADVETFNRRILFQDRASQMTQ